jgi:hypothetical protein
MQLIGLHGRRGAGKDQAVQFIMDWAGPSGLSVGSRGFASKLKHAAMTALGFVVTEQDAVVLADSLKYLGEVSCVIPDQSILYTIDGRKYLQLFGTEAHRDIFGKDFWVNVLLPMPFAVHDDATRHPYLEAWQRNFGDADIACIPDVRFENEAERIRALGGQVWYIDRPFEEEADDHASEQKLPDELIDVRIANDGSLDEFRAVIFAVSDILIEQKVNQ